MKTSENSVAIQYAIGNFEDESYFEKVLGPLFDEIPSLRFFVADMALAPRKFLKEANLKGRFSREIIYRACAFHVCDAIQKRLNREVKEERDVINFVSAAACRVEATPEELIQLVKKMKNKEKRDHMLNQYCLPTAVTPPNLWFQSFYLPSPRGDLSCSTCNNESEGNFGNMKEQQENLRKKIYL